MFFLQKCNLKIFNPGFGKEKQIIVQNAKGFFLLKLVRQYPVLTNSLWKWFFIFFVTSAFIIGLLLYIRRHIKTNNKKNLLSIINSFEDGVLLLDSTGKIYAINLSMEYLLKISRENILNKHYKNILSHLQDDLVQFIGNSLDNEQSHIQKEMTLNFDQVNSVYLVCFGSFLMDKTLMKIISFKDISDLVQSKRSIAWASMAQKLAHEIKTPLSTVMLTAQRLETVCEKSNNNTPEIENYLLSIKKQVDRLRKMSDTFMKFANIEKPVFEIIDLNKLLEQVILENKLKFGSQIKINTSFDEAISKLSADRQQLTIAIQNIIENSIQAMAGKGTLFFTTRLVQTLHGENHAKQNKIQIEIADTGCGIQKEYLHKLFQPFFSQHSDGTGMGLVITKKIVDDHKGDIRIESELGIGTTVFIELPC
ncbi:PAS domain-containing protein [candidate division KSB1 bacterium]|nr:PAS domain-containing protein [candidate division KSB1 bacterium]